MVSLNFEIKIEGAELGYFANELFTAEEKPHFKSNKDYTAPENLLGQKLSRKSDIWSIGCILYEIVKKKKLINTKKDSKFNLRVERRMQIQRDPRGVCEDVEFSLQNDIKLARKIQQALVIHSKIGKIPDYFWANKKVQWFWEHPVGEMIKSDKMLQDILEGFPQERVHQGSTLRQAIKQELFRDLTVGMFVETMNHFDRIFYKGIWEAEEWD